MELSHILVRAVSAYVFLLVLLRLSGKRTVLKASAFDLVVSLIVGDMIDDFIWGEVGAAQFIVGVTSIVVTHAVLAWIWIVSSQAAFRAGAK